MFLTPLQKLPGDVGDLDKIFVANGFEWLPKVQKIAQSCHTAHDIRNLHFKSSHQRILKQHLFTVNFIEMTKIKKN